MGDIGESGTRSPQNLASPEEALERVQVPAYNARENVGAPSGGGHRGPQVRGDGFSRGVAQLERDYIGELGGRLRLSQGVSSAPGAPNLARARRPAMATLLPDMLLPIVFYIRLRSGPSFRDISKPSFPWKPSSINVEALGLLNAL